MGRNEQLRRRQAPRASTHGPISRRTLVVGGLGLATVAGAAIWSRCDTRPVVAPPTPTAPPAKDRSQEPMPYYTSEEFNQVTAVTVKRYSEVFGLSAPTQEAIGAIQLTPPFSTISEEERQKWCDLYPCTQAVAYTQDIRDGHRIFVTNDLVQGVFSRSSNSPANRKVRDDFVESSVAHELTHWDKIEDLSASSPLYDLAFKEVVKKSPDLTGKKYTGRRIYGAIIDVSIPDINGGARLFDTTEEVEAYITQDVYMELTGRPTYFGKDSQSGFATKKALYTKLLTTLPLDKYSAVKMLKTTRTQAGGRQQWLQFVGSHFAKPGQNPLEVGFDILFAIDSGKIEDFTRLTTKQAA